ncbi:MAG: helix-turn-helix domain-containing protein [Chloroflexota bacterium]|nr:helix-turn-helix domain-containing protein [Chloroflexota bacterium]
MATMGRRLKQARKRLGWTQPALAAKSGVGIATVRRIEQETMEPRMATIRRLATTLQVREAWLAFGEGDESAPTREEV